MPLNGPFIGSDGPVPAGVLRGRTYRRVIRDVYVPSAEPRTLEQRCRAVLLRFPDATVDRGCAAALWNLPGWWGELVSTTRPPGSSVSREAGVRTRRAELHDDDRDELRGLRLTALGRTFVDLAETRSFEELVCLGDAVLRRTSRRQLAAAVGRAGRRKGVVLARAALAVLDPTSASPSESLIRLSLHAAGYTRMRHAVVVRDEAGEWVAEGDLGDPESGVLIQHEGEVHLRGSMAQQRADIDRDELSRQAGYEVVLYTAGDVSDPARGLSKVAAAHERAAQRRRGNGGTAPWRLPRD